MNLAGIDSTKIYYFIFIFSSFCCSDKESQKIMHIQVRSKVLNVRLKTKMLGKCEENACE